MNVRSNSNLRYLRSMRRNKFLVVEQAFEKEGHFIIFGKQKKYCMTAVCMNIKKNCQFTIQSGEQSHVIMLTQAEMNSSSVEEELADNEAIKRNVRNGGFVFIPQFRIQSF
jgi:hypothetical protein